MWQVSFVSHDLSHGFFPCSFFLSLFVLAVLVVARGNEFDDLDEFDDSLLDAGSFNNDLVASLRDEYFDSADSFERTRRRAAARPAAARPAEVVPSIPTDLPKSNVAAYQQYFRNVPAVLKMLRKEFKERPVPSMSDFQLVFNMTWRALSEAVAMKGDAAKQMARCDALLPDIRRVIPNWVSQEGRDGLALWSGGALELARWSTKQKNKQAGYLKYRALETNNLGLLFNGVNFDDNDSGAVGALWRSLSKEYVLGARGHVKVYFVVTYSLSSPQF